MKDRGNILTIFLIAAVTVIVGLAILIIVLVWVIRSPKYPENWSPWFNFYRSQNCVMLAHNTVTSDCYLLGVRAQNFPDLNNELTMVDVINSFHLTVRNVKNDLGKSNLNPNDWNCNFYNTDQTLGLQIYKPHGGDIFDCWPKIPFGQDQELLSSVPDDRIANWKTYFNHKLDFSFKYPGDWKLSEGTDELSASFKSPDYLEDLKFKPTDRERVGPLISGAEFSMSASQAKENYNVLDNYYLKDDTTNSPIKVLDRKEIIIDHQKGVRVETQWGPVKGLASSAVTFLGRTYYFHIQYAPEKRDYSLKVFDQILSTFKFVGQADNTQFGRNDAQRRNDLNMLRTALNLYYSDNNTFPYVTGDAKLGLSEYLEKKYLLSLPDDPYGRGYYYEYLPNKNSFILCAAMEMTPIDAFTLSACQGHNCGGYQCNSGVKNP